MASIVRSPEEVEAVLNWAAENRDNGVSAYPGMSYEDGILAMYEWLSGEIDDDPRV